MSSFHAILCAPNFRDMGGASTLDGGTVKRGMLFRSEAIGSPDEDDAARLAATGIRLVCDLRGGRERDLAPNRYWRETSVELLEMDVVADIRASAELWNRLRDDPSATGAHELMLHTYRSMPAACASHLAGLFDRLAEGGYPLLVHCTAGKDRTGFFSAMILHALGVSEDEIIQDYLESGNRPNPAVSEATRQMMQEAVGAKVGEEALAALTGVRAEYLGASFAAIRAQHGSPDRYLERLVGMDASRRQRLRDLFVE